MTACAHPIHYRSRTGGEISASSNDMSDIHSNASGPRELDLAPPDNDVGPCGLAHDPLGDPSFEKAIEDLVTHVRDTTSFSTSLQFDGWEPIDDAEKSRYVLRIVRDAVAHAVANSGGTHIVVSLARHDRRCRVSIFDVGRPYAARDHATAAAMDLEEAGERMEELAERIDGTVETERRASGGMAIAVSFEV